MRISIVSVIVLLAVPLPAGAEDICAAASKLLEARQDLSPLRGNKLDEGTWAATVTFDGFDCRISSFSSGLSYRCSTAVEADKMLERLNALGEQMWQCGVVESRMYTQHKNEEYETSWAMFVPGNGQIALASGKMFAPDTMEYGNRLEIRFFED
jgi:hypothetical protein